MISNITFFTGCVLLLLFMTRCGGGGENKPKSPEKAMLTFPAQNALCTTGTVISAGQSTVTFTWNASALTDSYEVVVKNLLTGTIITQDVSTNQLELTISRDAPYSWYVISKSTIVSTTAQSDTWKFYNSGLGAISHLPFPADSLSPGFAQYANATGGTIDLRWKGSDVDNDIVGYDVYLGATSSPALLKGSVTDMFLNNVAVISGNTYYWKVITKDSQGNTSDSGLFKFTVN